MSKLIIGINATILDDKPTGLGIYTINIINELSKVLESTDKIIVYTSTPEYFTDEKIVTKKVTNLVKPKYGKKAGLIRFLWLQFIFPLLVTKDHCDIIYSTTHHGNLFITRKQILTIHDLLAIKFPKQYKLQNLYFKYVIPHLLKKSPFLFTVSDNTKLDIVNYFNYPSDNISVIYNSYNKEHFKLINGQWFKKKYGNYLLFLGASFPHKNVKNAIKAFIDVVSGDNNLNVKLIIVNRKNDYLESVKRFFKANSYFENRVEFVDYVAYNELPEMYSNAVALLYPSLYEGFGIPPLEAMACGCPVIVSNNSSLPEVCGDSALYIDPNDIGSISYGIRKMLLDDDMRENLKNKGLIQANKFSWEYSAKKLYKELELKTSELIN
ncbi:glycosyltransferase family 1 protein [Sporolactobacillus shoreae]|uniref:Glycosyltransferase family 1 protein n=1 Tax=Sporolactobacillus shoreae TaxID=1465501 RepID=A0A4Z0GU38_9BACL|nr:glycosyltransferase family 1 protein [Sporolactobacillus shoreae]TGA99822.1 glycosyltransferase family 1 protein [Sporolactobacillus shoreae]